MNRPTKLFLTFLLCLSAGSAKAQTGEAGAFRFLEYSPAAQSASLGGNHVAIFDANSTLFTINPAFLTPTQSKNVSASFVNYFSDSKYGMANVAYHLPQVGTVGVGIRYFGYGEFDRFDESGLAMGTFSASDLAFTTALSTQLSEKLTAGTSVDIIRASYDIYSSTAIAGNAGIFYKDTERLFSAGLTIRNVGDQLSYFNETREALPFDISLGISKKPEQFPFHLHLTLRQLNNWDLRVFGETEQPDLVENLMRHAILGGEAKLGDHLLLRLGYNRYLHEQAKTNENFDFAGASIGLGIKAKGLIIDISRSSYSDLGGVLQFSIRSQIN